MSFKVQYGKSLLLYMQYLVVELRFVFPVLEC